MSAVSRVARYAIDQHRYCIGVGVGMMCANPQPYFFWVGGAWIVVGLALGMFRNRDHD